MITSQPQNNAPLRTSTCTPARMGSRTRSERPRTAGYLILFAALCGAVALPTSAQAQNGSQAASSSAGMVAPSAVFSKLLSGQEKDIVGAADAMPADKFNFAPTSGEFKGVSTFAQQVKHVAGANYAFYSSWKLPNMKNPDDIDKLSSKEDIMQALRESFVFAHAAMNSITPANAFAVTGNQQSTRVGTAAHALGHMMDHYGQLVEYLRMNGIVPPASRKPGM